MVIDTLYCPSDLVQQPRKCLKQMTYYQSSLSLCFYATKALQSRCDIIFQVCVKDWKFYFIFVSGGVQLRILNQWEFKLIYTYIFFFLALRNNALEASPIHFQWSCMCVVEDSSCVDNLKPRLWNNACFPNLCGGFTPGLVFSPLRDFNLCFILQRYELRVFSGCLNCQLKIVLLLPYYN